MRGKNRKGGFTLVELIVVIVIILVLAAVLVPSVMKYINSASKAKCAETKQSLATEMLADIVLNDEIPQEGIVPIPDAMSTRYKCPSDGTYTANYANGIIKISCDVHDEGKKPGGGSGYTPVKVAASAKDYEAPLNAVIKTLYDSIVADRLKEDENRVACVMFERGKVSKIYYYKNENESKDGKTSPQNYITVSGDDDLHNKISEALKDKGYTIATNSGAERIYFDWNGNAISGCDENGKPTGIAGQYASASISFKPNGSSKFERVTNKTGEWAK